MTSESLEKNTKYKILKMQSLESALGSAIFKIIITIVIVYWMEKDTNYSHILINILLLSFTYLLCTIFQICLRITRNYIVAFIIFIVAIIGFFYLYDMVYPFFPDVHSTVGEYIAAAFVTLLLAVPFFLDIRKIITLLKLKREFQH